MRQRISDAKYKLGRNRGSVYGLVAASLLAALLAVSLLAVASVAVGQGTATLTPVLNWGNFTAIAQTRTYVATAGGGTPTFTPGGPTLPPPATSTSGPSPTAWWIGDTTGTPHYQPTLGPTAAGDTSCPAGPPPGNLDFGWAAACSVCLNEFRATATPNPAMPQATSVNESEWVFVASDATCAAGYCHVDVPPQPAPIIGVRAEFENYSCLNVRYTGNSGWGSALPSFFRAYSLPDDWTPDTAYVFGGPPAMANQLMTFEGCTVAKTCKQVGAGTASALTWAYMCESGPLEVKNIYVMLGDAVTEATGTPTPTATASPTAGPSPTPEASGPYLDLSSIASYNYNKPASGSWWNFGTAGTLTNNSDPIIGVYISSVSWTSGFMIGKCDTFSGQGLPACSAIDTVNLYPDSDAVGENHLTAGCYAVGAYTAFFSDAERAEYGMPTGAAAANICSTVGITHIGYTAGVSEGEDYWRIFKIGTGSDAATASVTTYLIRWGSGGSSGTATPTPTATTSPTPYPTMSSGFIPPSSYDCSEYQTMPQIEPAVDVSWEDVQIPEECSENFTLIPDYEVNLTDLPGIGDLISFVSGSDASVRFQLPGVKICVKLIKIPQFKILGFRIPLELMFAPLALYLFRRFMEL